MNDTNENKQKRKSGAVELLYEDEWKEILKGKEKDKPYIVPKHGVISVRFPADYEGKQIRIFAESIE